MNLNYTFFLVTVILCSAVLELCDYTTSSLNFSSPSLISIGMYNLNIVYSPSTLIYLIQASIFKLSCAQMGSPSPVPSQLLSLWSDTFSSKINSCLSGGMPFPLSFTSIEMYVNDILRSAPTWIQS